ncbi:MAG: TadE family protein [Actinomycetota bacterium]
MKVSDERGAATLELAIVAPTLMVLILGVLQFGLWYHAQHVVQTAALEAARSASAENGTVSDAKDRGTQVVSAALGRMTEAPSVEIQMSLEVVTARVTTSMRGLLPIPGLESLTLRSSAISYRERFRPAGSGP